MIQIRSPHRIDHVKWIDHVEFPVVLEDPDGVEALQDIGSCDLNTIVQRHIPGFDNLPAADDLGALEGRLLAIATPETIKRNWQMNSAFFMSTFPRGI